MSNLMCIKDTYIFYNEKKTVLTNNKKTIEFSNDEKKIVEKVYDHFREPNTIDKLNIENYSLLKINAIYNIYLKYDVSI